MDTAEVSALIADVTARVVLPRWRTLAADQVFHKGHGDIVTVADREAEAELGAALARPGDLVVGEEAIAADATALGDLPSASHAWVIDPVDGTANFARGSADFAVMLAEVRHGVTERAWIWQPVHERLYVAVRGDGAWCNDRPLTAVPRGPQVKGTMQRDRPPTPPRGVTYVPSLRCCGVEYPLLATGGLDFLGFRSTKPWDHLPGALLVSETGGRVATREGRDYAAGVAGRSLIAAATPGLWQRVVGGLVEPR